MISLDGVGSTTSVLRFWKKHCIITGENYSGMGKYAIVFATTN